MPSSRTLVLNEFNARCLERLAAQTRISSLPTEANPCFSDQKHETSKGAIAQAPGKIIVLGEHAVVYGHRALAGTLDRVVRCRSEPARSKSQLHIPVWDVEVDEDDPSAPGRALAALVRAAGSAPCDLCVESDLPARAGLGSSAALCLAIARCLRPSASPTEQRRIADAGERQFHDRPSGIDVALCQHGGLASYSLSEGLRGLPASTRLSLVVGLSGLRRSTATQVTKVGRAMASGDTKTAESIARIGECSELGIAALAKSDLQRLGHCINQCHEALTDLGVSLAKLDAMVSAARNAGALGAKLTGAGGGGAVIALAPGREAHVQAAFTALGCESFTCALGIWC